VKKLILLNCILILMPLCAFAATINVPGDQPTIQAGIDAAVDGDIVLLADGTYTGVGNYNADFSGKSVTVKSSGGADNCIVDCEGLGRGFIAYNGETITLEGLTVKNGDAGDDFGGGVYANESEKLVAIDCLFNGNNANYGGAVYCYSSSLKNCSFVSNNAAFGGAVNCRGIEETTSITSSLTSCSFTSNSAYMGGAVNSSDNSSIFIGCAFTSNSASGLGGAVVTNTSSLLFTNCIFNSNSAYRGGAVSQGALESVPASFTNCIFAFNKATVQGGAIWNEIPYDSVGLVRTIKNCILWDNIAPESSDVYEKEKPLIVTYSDIQEGHTGEGNIDSDPLFLSTNTAALYLHPYSPCIDSGTSDGAPGDDIDGYIRPIGSGDDMGAYEYRNDIYIWEGHSSSWNDATNWNNGEVPEHSDFTIVSSIQATVNPEINIDEAAVGTLLIDSGTLTIDQGRLTVGGS